MAERPLSAASWAEAGCRSGIRVMFFCRGPHPLLRHHPGDPTHPMNRIPDPPPHLRPMQCSGRRTECDEGWLAATLRALTARLRAGRDRDEVTQLATRDAMEKWIRDKYVKRAYAATRDVNVLAAARQRAAHAAEAEIQRLEKSGEQWDSTTVSVMAIVWLEAVLEEAPGAGGAGPAGSGATSSPGTSI